MCRARSSNEFISKLAIVIEEADETVFWLELLVNAEIMPANKLEPLIQEASEWVAIMAASYRTAKDRQKNH